MQHSVVFITMCAFAPHYFHLGICKHVPNLFIYPPDYVKADAPRYNQSDASGETACIVSINLEIWAINEISLQRQDLEVDLILTILWTDYRLTVNPNITLRNLWPVMDKNEAQQIWTPTILFRNCKDCSPVSLSSGKVLYVNKASGVILAQIRILRRFTCAIDLRAYPMDIQFCQLQLYTYEDTVDAIQLQHRYSDTDVKMNSNLTLTEYSIAPIIKTSCIHEDAEGEVFSCLELRIRLDHLVTYHLLTSFAPSSFIVILSWISFWLPLDLAPARVALGLTSLLTLATRLDQAQKNLPPVAYIKAIDVWMFACIFLVSSSLCEFAISHYLFELTNARPKAQPRRIQVQPVSKKDNKLACSSTIPRTIPHSDQTPNYIGTSFDRVSRIIFPLTFFVFNIVYWNYYLTYYK